MKYVLDTSTLSLLMRGEPSVSRELTSRPRTAILVPQPAVAEIEYGLARLPPSKRKTSLRKRFDIFLDELQRADWDDDVSRAFGSIKADLERRGARIEDFDVALAAHALALDATLVSDNLDHFKRIKGLRLENWHSPAPS